MSKAERVSSVDTTWLRMDRPANPMSIIGLLILEGPVDLNKLEALIAARFLAIPRFRQHIEMRAGEYWWVDDPYFDETRHIKRVRLPGQGGQNELQLYMAQLASDPLDKSRPLWQLHIVEDYQGGAAVVARIHHAVADGMALVSMMLCVTDGGDPRVWTANTGAEAPAWLSLPGIKTLQKGIDLATGLLQEAKALAANPAKTARTGAGIAGELAWLLLMPEDSWTRFKGKPSGNKRVAWTDPVPLGEVKAVSKALGCTVNDVLLASVAGALCEYLKDKGDAVSGVEIRALVPVDMRKTFQAGQLGNKFGIVGVELPVGIEHPLMRVAEVRRRMQALKQSLEPPVTLGMFAVLGYTPKILQDRLFNLLLHRATAVMTNVPGPQFPLLLGGATIKQMMFWVPQSGDIGMGVSILSYNGMVQFGLITDAQMVPDPEAVIAHFRPQFEQLLYHVLMSQWGETGAEAAKQAIQPKEAEVPVARARKSRPASKRRKPSSLAKAVTQAEETAPLLQEAPKAASKVRAKRARAIPPAVVQAKTEGPVAKPRKARPASQPRTRSAQPTSAPLVQPQPALEPKNSARRKLPRT